MMAGRDDHDGTPAVQPPQRAPMSYTAADLVGLFDLERIELDVFRGHSRDLGTGRIFGGQVLAQSLVAAGRTVPEDRPAHSLHGYFMLAGDLTIPVLYQ